MKTWTIELRADFDTPEKDKIIEDAMKMAAKHVFTTALLIKDKRDPQVVLSGGDFFTPTEEIMLADDLAPND